MLPHIKKALFLRSLTLYNFNLKTIISFRCVSKVLENSWYDIVDIRKPQSGSGFGARIYNDEIEKILHRNKTVSNRLGF